MSAATLLPFRRLIEVSYRDGQPTFGPSHPQRQMQDAGVLGLKGKLVNKIILPGSAPIFSTPLRGPRLEKGPAL